MKCIKELWQYREMIISLVKRDLKSKYKGSVLGFMWMLLNPLFQLIIYTIVFSIIMRSGIEQFYLFLFVALIPWIFFSTCLAGGTTVIFAQQDMIKKIYFPREVLPIAFTTSQFVNMLLSFVVIFVVFGVSSRGLHPMALVFLPIVMLIEYLLCLGITYIASALTVYFRDLEHILSIVSMAWMYMTPILYDASLIPEELLPLFNLNPMTPIIASYRDIFYYGVPPKSEDMLRAFVFAAIILLVGQFAFKHLQRHFAEEL